MGPWLWSALPLITPLESSCETLLDILMLAPRWLSWNYHENIVNIFETPVKPCSIFLCWHLAPSPRSSINLYRNYCDNFETIVRLSWKYCEHIWNSCETLLDILILAPCCQLQVFNRAISKLLWQFWDYCETIMKILWKYLKILWNLVRYSYASACCSQALSDQAIYVETILKPLWNYHENIVNHLWSILKNYCETIVKQFVLDYLGTQSSNNCEQIGN